MQLKEKLLAIYSSDAAWWRNKIRRCAREMLTKKHFIPQVRHLSGGQKRRLCLLLALLPPSALVVLDEPTAGVDVFTRKDIWKVIGRFLRSLKD